MGPYEIGNVALLMYAHLIEPHDLNTRPAWFFSLAENAMIARLKNYVN